MDKVYAIFAKSNHPTGRLTEPIFMCPSLEVAERMANSAALNSIQHYTITEYKLVNNDDIIFPKDIYINATLKREDREVKLILNSITNNPKLEDATNKFIYKADDNDSNIIYVQGTVEVINESYAETINKFKEKALKELRNINN